MRSSVVFVVAPRHLHQTVIEIVFIRGAVAVRIGNLGQSAKLIVLIRYSIAIMMNHFGRVSNSIIALGHIARCVLHRHTESHRIIAIGDRCLVPRLFLNQIVEFVIIIHNLGAGRLDIFCELTRNVIFILLRLTHGSNY